jgi:hypothetical protein
LLPAPAPAPATTTPAAARSRQQHAADDPAAPATTRPPAPTMADRLSAEPEAAATEAELASLNPELCLARPEEVPMIAEMKQQVAAELAAAPPRSEEPDVTGDLRFLRFLRSRSHDVPLATEAMRSMLLWRTANDISGSIRPACIGKPLIEASLPMPKAGEEGDGTAAALFRELIGPINVGSTRDGHIISISQDGAGDPTTVLELISEDEIRLFFRSFLELRMMLMDAESRRRRSVVRCVQIRDLAGAGLHLLKHSSAILMLKRILGEALDNYCESTHCVLFLNTPSVFTAIWAVIKPMLSARSQAKCQFLGSGVSEYRDVVLSYAGLPALRRLYELNGAGHTTASLLDNNAQQQQGQQQQQQQAEEGQHVATVGARSM